MNPKQFNKHLNMNAIYLSEFQDNFSELDEFLCMYINENNIILRMEWFGVLEIVFPDQYYDVLKMAVQDLIEMNALNGFIIQDHLLVVHPDEEIERVSNIINELKEERDLEILVDCLNLKKYYSSTLRRLEWTMKYGDVDDQHIKILSRTIFVSRLGRANVQQIRTLFRQFGYIDKIDYDQLKKRCFIKYRYRIGASAAIEAVLHLNDTKLLVRYAWPFGSRN
eukprot:NODE_141_length_15967_cov_0.946118.p7 type:complete len:223 gc:universal NODE_141_length_15967_cov_0.946118:14640-15308(+)